MKKKYGMGPVESWKYLNLGDGKPPQWDLFPADMAELTAAMDAIPTIAPHKEPVWRVLTAIL